MANADAYHLLQAGSVSIVGFKNIKSQSANASPSIKTVDLEGDLPDPDLTPEELSCHPCPSLMVFPTLAILWNTNSPAGEHRTFQQPLHSLGRLKTRLLPHKFTITPHSYFSPMNRKTIKQHTYKLTTSKTSIFIPLSSWKASVTLLLWILTNPVLPSSLVPPNHLPFYHTMRQGGWAQQKSHCSQKEQRVAYVV